MRNWIALLFILFVAAACAAPEDSTDDRPVLVGEATLADDEQRPTREITPTIPQTTAEVISPLQNVTVDAEYVLVTPTLPPSKTPTMTPSHSPTPTTTPTPTMTGTATATSELLPTSEIVQVTAAIAISADRICDTNWFFIQPRPESCPIFPPTASNGVYQEFENGYMVWVGSQDGIYVLYNDPLQPRWQVVRDYFVEGQAESSSAYDSPPAPNLWQPRRGFGLVWRENSTIRNRLGWATQQWEEPYSVQVQTSDDGSVWVSTPRDFVFALLPGGVNWNQYSTSGAGGVQVISTSSAPSQP